MGLSLITLALARKSAKKATDAAVAQALIAANAYTDSKFNEIASFGIEIVNELPPLAEADSHTIYFVERTSPSGEADYYYEYIAVNGSWELIGSTELNLSNYWTIDEVKAYVESKEYTLPMATANKLGGVKINGDSIQIDQNGTISIVDGYLDNIIDGNFDNISNQDISNLFN
mgnify:CR=1 FL=1